MLLRVWVEAGEVLQLALSEVEVGVGESCGCTLALREKKHYILVLINNSHNRDPESHQCSPL